MEQDKHTLWFAVLVIISLATYGLYSETRRSLQETNDELRKAQDEITQLMGESELTIASQQELISQQEAELEEVKASEELLQEAVESFQNVSSGGVSLNSLLSDFAPAVVRLVCLQDELTRGLQQGSGVLYKGEGAFEGIGEYYVQTNLHVVQTEDGSPSQCIVAVYPDPNKPSSYVIFRSKGYKYYESGIDLAFIEPELVGEHSRAGEIDDLEMYARNAKTTKLCSSAGIGDHITVLGYPSIGGDTLTVTDGIVSGFEFRSGARYIKTSAKIDQGNSGGIAIKDTGCVLGIPTFVQSQIESLGRILDLDYLLN